MKIKQGFDVLFQAIFWVWNLTFLMLAYAGILPLVGILLIVATVNREVPIDFFLTLVGLIAVPAACTFLGGVRFRKQPLELMRLFYGVEAPLFILCLIRLFLLRETTPASTQIISTLVVCVFAFLGELLYGYAGAQESTIPIPTRYRAIASWVQLVCHSLMLLVGLYVGILLMFYAMPVAGFLVTAFFSFQWVGSFLQMLSFGGLSVIWWALLFSFLFIFSSTLFIAMPSMLAGLYIHSSRKIWLAFASQYGKSRALLGAGAAITASLLIFVSLQQQPQTRAFTLLNRSVLNESDAVGGYETYRQALLAKSEVIREGLVNAYLSPYRYLSARQESNQIQSMYSSTFGLPKSASQFLQNSYNQLMSPFLYNGSSSDVEKAEKQYAQFFDAPIQKAERESIQHALQSTYNRGEAKAGLLKIDKKNVWLAQQQITVQPSGDWADVELYEVYENQTPQQQEVFYSFSLPESATITGLWLGDTDNRAKRFPFTISPRGAAQKVYNEQVKVRVDPALLEQVGPRHYRLRAFPVPVRPSSSTPQPGLQQPQKLHLWLTYKVMQQDAGWALPQLAEKRNIFWSKDTKRLRNGQTVAFQKDAWVESFVPAAGVRQPALHQVNLSSSDRILAKPLTNQDYALPQAKRFAVVLDSSRSMAARTKEVKQTFAWLKERGFADNNLANNDADLYITAAVGAVPQRIDDLRRFDAAKMTFYGTLQLKEMLQQFGQLRGDTLYDAILMVTDEGSYELSDDKKVATSISAPLWVVHLGGQFPPAYDDATLKSIQDSGGGVSTDIQEVMQRVATKAALGQSAVNVVDGYAWLMEKAGTGTPPLQSSNSEGFEQVAARQLVLGLSKEKDKDKLVGLDAIHAIAKKYSIVTPYSSALVLVNDQQREALKQAEANKDRFDRKVEDGKEQLTKPSNPLNVSGTPEPEEWLLMSIVAIALLFLIRRQRVKSNL